MKIVRLDPPTDPSIRDIPAVDARGRRYLLQDLAALYYGEAINTRGRRYRFSTNPGEGASCVFCEERSTSGHKWWKQVSPPTALSAAVKAAWES
jgi:hypothetical protein